METNITCTKDGMHRINGRGKDDLDYARKCVNEIIGFVRDKKINIDQYESYRFVITKSALNEVFDDLTAINYFRSELTSLMGFFTRVPEFHTILSKASEEVERAFISTYDTANRLKNYIVEHE